MKVAISGITGFIGKQLSDHLLKSGNELIAISRRDFEGGRNQLAKVINSADVIINLAGSPVLQRWNKENRDRILSSRVDTTRFLVDAVRHNYPDHRPKVFINASAIGIYNDSGTYDEFSTGLGTGFLAMVCKAWESETVPLKDLDLRLCIVRIGIVLGKGGGSLGKMLPIFKAGLGGRIGTGRQPFPFIHISDFCRAIDHLISHQNCEGVYNLVSPQTATNSLFTAALASMLHRPAFFTVPEFALKLIYGGASEMLTKGSFVKPTRLQKEGFQFHFPDISSALADLVIEK
jgi:uncharacterized protein (TIGR01777 family)